MAIHSHHIPYGHSRIHYLQMGEGAEWLFCFHGYGESASSFRLLEAVLGSRFTIIAIDMPFHGDTEWNDGLLFTPEALLSLIHTIKPADRPMHLLGYSMGGRIALQLLMDTPGEIVRVALAAPDGLHRNKWQWLATRTTPGNRLFRWLMRRPKPVLALLDRGAAMGIYPKSLHKFVHYYLDDASQRKMLYERWTTLRAFRPRIPVLGAVIRGHAIPVRLLFGRYDAVILTRHADPLVKAAPGQVIVRTIEAGHQLLKEKYLEDIIAMLRD